MIKKFFLGIQLLSIYKFMYFTVWLTFIISCLFAAPSAAPASASVSDVTYSSITVQWEPVDCIHRNGDIHVAGYLVQYGVEGSGNIQTLEAPLTSSNLDCILLLTTLLKYQH